MMRRLLQRLLGDQSGTAAIEFAGVGVVLMIGAMNAIEVGRYAIQASQVSHAAEAGAQAALKACDIDHVPATTKCSNLSSAITTAIQSTRLGTYVQLHGSVSEAYYCRTTAGTLVLAANVNNKPSDCDNVSGAASSSIPALYLKVPVGYVFQPIFSGLTIASSFPVMITRTTWMRMA
jgi:Flp pilus assembly protein TadG